MTLESSAPGCEAFVTGFPDDMMPETEREGPPSEPFVEAADDWVAGTEVGAAPRAEARE